MTVSVAEVERIANLAKLNFTAEEKERFVQQFNQILAYMEKIAELDLSSVQPTAHMVSDENRLRPDEIGSSLTQEQALANAPAKNHGLFSVPKVIG